MNTDILPFPNSVFYLTGISLITLVYATYAKTINTFPKAVSDGITTASIKIGEVGKSIRAGANDLYGRIASPSSAGPIMPVQEKPLIPATNNVNQTISNMNPFAGTEQPQPQRIGGSKKKRATKNKKTKRSRH